MERWSTDAFVEHLFERGPVDRTPEEASSAIGRVLRGISGDAAPGWRIRPAPVGGSPGMTAPEHPRVAEVARLLREAGAAGEVRHLPDSARTAAAAAAQLGVEVGAIANSLVFDVGGDPLLVMTSGAHRVEERWSPPCSASRRSPAPPPSSSARHTGQAIGGVAPWATPSRSARSWTSSSPGTTRSGRPPGHPHTVFPTTYDELLAAHRRHPGRGGAGSRRHRLPHRRGGPPDDRHVARTRVIELPIRWLRDHMHEALVIYGLAMGYDSAVVAGRYGYAIQHTDRPGFRAVGAFAESPEGEQLVGFGYGYLVAPGPVVARPGPRRPRPADGEEVAARRLRGVRAARPPRPPEPGAGPPAAARPRGRPPAPGRPALHARLRHEGLPAVPRRRLRRPGARLPLPRRLPAVRDPRRAPPPASARAAPAKPA